MNAAALETLFKMAFIRPPSADHHSRIVTSSLKYGAQDSPFLSLPGELRNAIFIYVLDSSTYYFNSASRGVDRYSRKKASLRSASNELNQGRPRMPLLLTCRQTYCETFEISLQLSTFMFSCLAILPRCTVLPDHVRARIHHISFLESITVESSAQPFLDEVLPKGIQLRDLLPNVKSIKYNVQADEITMDEFLEVNGPHFSSYGVVQQWFENAGEIELDRRMV